jgi:hypothetical protein
LRIPPKNNAMGGTMQIYKGPAPLIPPANTK